MPGCRLGDAPGEWGEETNFLYNRSAFDGWPNDPIITTDHRASHYGGAQTVLAMSRGPHNGRIEVYGFYQRDDALFGLQSNGVALNQAQTVNGNLHYSRNDWDHWATGSTSSST